jgi:hypothetical protein
MSVFGKYLSKMKLRQYCGYGYHDLQRYREEHGQIMQEQTEEKQKADLDFAEELRQKKEAGEITEAQYQTLMPTPMLAAELP